MTEPMNQALEIIELREELQRTKLLLQNCNGDIVRADRELASLREQIEKCEDKLRFADKNCELLRGHRDELTFQLKQQEEVIRELVLVAEGYIYYYRYVRPNDEFGKIKDVNSLIEKAKSLTTKDK